MAGLENLFSIEPTLPNVQAHKMPDNPERWAEVLTTYLREQYPDVAKLPVVVEFRKKDEQSGTSIGAIHVTSEEAQKSVFVPFVIRKFQLAPLDIWMEAKTQAVHPLTKDTFKEVFFVQSPAESLDARPADSSGTYFNDPSLWNTNYPPLQGRYSYASAGYALLDQIADTMTKEDGDVFKQTLQDNPHLVSKFQKHGHAEIITKLAKKSYPMTNDFKASAMSLIPVSAASVKREDINKYSLLSNVEGLFDTAQVQEMDREECAKFLSKITGKPEDFLNEVDQEGEKMLIVRKPADGVFLYDKDEAGPEEAKDFAVYRVKTKVGMQLDGIVLPYIVDFAGKKKNYKLFLSKAHASFQASIAGVRQIGITDKTPCKYLEPADIRVGETGTFVFLDDGKAIATEPVTIKAIEKYGPLTVVDMNGKKFSVRRGYGPYFTKEEMEAGSGLVGGATPAMKGMKSAPKRTYLDAHGMIETRKDIFVIPQHMIWIPMGGMTDVSSTPAEWMMKEAASKMELEPMTVQFTGIDFNIFGAGLPKLAMDERNAKLLLATAGVSVDKIAKVIKKAKAGSKAKLHGVDRLGSRKDKASNVGKLIAKIADVTQSLKRNLIQEAALVTAIEKTAEDGAEDTATVDLLLSLNFINADNLAKFVAYKPIMDKVLDYLAELTLAARLGLKDVPEAALVTAMTKLMEVSDGLQKLQVSMKRPSTKTAAISEPTKPLKTAKRYLPKSKLISIISD